MREFILSNAETIPVCVLVAVQYARGHTREMVLVHVDSRDTLMRLVSYRLGKMQETFNLHLLAPDFKQFVNRFVGGGIVEVPHSFYAVVLAMQKCRRVKVFGLSPLLGKDFIKRSYYNSDSSQRF